MSKSRVTENVDNFVLEAPQALLESVYIEAYLRGRGFTLKSVRELPEEEARQLLIEASVYASTRLAEVEKRAQFMHDIEGTAHSL